MTPGACSTRIRHAVALFTPTFWRSRIQGLQRNTCTRRRQEGPQLRPETSPVAGIATRNGRGIHKPCVATASQARDHKLTFTIAKNVPTTMLRMMEHSCRGEQREHQKTGFLSSLSSHRSPTLTRSWGR